MSIQLPAMSDEAEELIKLIIAEDKTQQLDFGQEWVVLIFREGINQHTGQQTITTKIRPLGGHALQRPHNNDLPVLEELHRLRVITLWWQLKNQCRFIFSLLNQESLAQ
jgi:hypothetical protein